MDAKLARVRFFPMMDAEGSGGTGGTQDVEPVTHGAEARNAEPQTETQRTFTQEDLNRIAAQEKRQGMASALKALGFEDEKSAQEWIKKQREIEDSKKDEATKALEKLQLEKQAKAEAEKKADLLEKRFKVVASGAPADKADDVVLLATAKMTDGKTFEECLEDLKKTYPMFFEAGTATGSTGTGTGGTPPRSKANTGAGSIGKRLAEQRKSKAPQKSGYFTE